MSTETEDFGEIYAQEDTLAEMEEYKSLFIQESREHLQSMTEALITLENNPDDVDALNKIFRSAHTVKGSSAMMGFQSMSRLTHAMEDAFDQLRKGASMPEGLMDVIFVCMDLLEARLNNLENDVDEDLDFQRYIDILRGISFEEESTLDTDGESGKVEGNLLKAFTDDEARAIIETSCNLGEGERCLGLYIALSEDCMLKAARGYMALNKLGKVAEILQSEPKLQVFEDGLFDGNEFVVVIKTAGTDEEVCAPVLQVAEVAGVEITQIDEDYIKSFESAEDIADTKDSGLDSAVKLQQIKTIRVQTDQLDKLMNLVGELVINKIQLGQIAGNYRFESLKHSIDNIDRLTTELQDIVMRIRMVPVGQVFNRFPRLVRDLSRKVKKRVRFVLEGKDIELDRTVLEEIGEPLIHLLRNAVDHGIETPDERKTKGKPEEGVIRLVAERRQDHVMIIVQDDGAGLPAEKIKKKALERGLVSESEARVMSQEQLVNLIMLPGFSTAEKITDVAGRGVGMDVVRTKIEALGGSVLLESWEGEGTKISLKLPLTLSIIKAMLFEAAGNAYAVPVSYVNELTMVEKGQLKRLGAFNAIDLRGDIVPIVSIHEMLNLPQRQTDICTIMVINREPSKFGLMVDSVVGMQEIVTKNLDDSLQDIQGVSGVTIMGDGKVILILDPLSLYMASQGR